MQFTITFDCTETEDKEISCIICGRHVCEMEIELLGEGRTIAVGLHERCADHHESRLRLRKEREAKKHADGV